MSVRRTAKQREIMALIMKAVVEGRYLTIAELHSQLSYPCSYGAVRVSVRFLEDHGMLSKVPQGRTTGLSPTSEAYTWFHMNQ